MVEQKQFFFFFFCIDLKKDNELKVYGMDVQSYSMSNNIFNC